MATPKVTETGYQSYIDVADALEGAEIPFKVHYPSEETAVFTIEHALNTQQLGLVTTWGGAMGRAEDGSSSYVVRIIASRADRG